MPAYFVAVRDEITDPEQMKIYGEKAGAASAGHKMAPKAVYGKVRSLEGLPVDGAVILEFATFEEAEAWYDSKAYQDAAQHRFKGAKYRTFIVQGL